jgi:prepilin-type N-terminal cleavage/methylation domain-containing protein
MPTSAARALLPRPRAERTAPARSGFTLIEVLVALAILALMAAVVIPGLARRLDVAFVDSDLQQARASAELLPARVATLGIDLLLDAGTLGKPLPDGQPPLDIPAGWSATVEKPVALSHTGTCDAGSLLLREPVSARRWRIAVQRVTCAVDVMALDAGAS